MGKAQLRAEIRVRRAAGHTPSSDFVPRVIGRIPAGSRVCCYVHLPGEPPTDQIIAALLVRGEQVCLPVAGPGGRMEWVDANSSQPWAAWGLPGQPPCLADRIDLPAVDFVLVPALAITSGGQRLGQGGGYYDRFLSEHEHVRTLALVWSDEIVTDVFAEPHDITVDQWVAADG